MPFDFTTAVAMTKALSTLLRNATDAEITEALTYHGLPRVKLYLLSATDGTGAPLLYSALTDMADSMLAAAAENLVEAMLDEPIIRDALRRCAAAFACAWLIVSKFSVMDSQQEQAAMLEKQALADLTRLTKSPLLQAAAASAAKTILTEVGLGVDPSLFIATDVDETTIDLTTNTARPYEGAQLPYVGAPDAGKASAVINGIAVEVVVNENDRPIDIVGNLVLAFQALPSNASPNISLAPNEVAYTNDSRMVEYVDPLSGDPVVTPFRYPRSMAKMTILPKNYDNVLDVAVMTIFLSKRIESAPTTFEPGIVGLIYGTTNTTQGLTKFGPHAIAVELKTGKTSAIISPSEDPANTIISDSFFFLDGGVPTADPGVVTYRVNNGSIRTVNIPAGSDAARLCELLAQDMAAAAGSQSILGAVRPSSKITVNGTTLMAPGIEMVAFGIQQQLAYMVVHILEVPNGIIFGVVPSTLITQNTFDKRPKSVVVTTKIGTLASQGGGVEPEPSEVKAEVYVATYVPTVGLQRLLDRINKIR